MIPVLVFYCSSVCAHHLGSKIEKYGKLYLELHMSEIDELIMWVHDMREKYGVMVFENAATIMNTGILIDVDSNLSAQLIL